MTAIPDLRKRMRQGDRLVGLFVRLIQQEAAELLADAGLDFVILDVEHGTHARTEISRFVFSAQALGLPVLVRLPDAAETWLQHAISIGAAGVVVPHVNSLQQARHAAGFARGLALERAYAGMARRSAYRKGSWADFQRQAADTLVFVAQLDEPPGVPIAAEVAALEDVDCLFLGSLGLALAMGHASPSAPAVNAALESMCRAGVAAGKSVGVHVMDPAQQSNWLEQGARLLVVGSDYALLRNGAAAQVDAFRQLP